jgi:hypothetical protein
VARPTAYLLSVGAAILAVLGFAAPAHAADGPTSITIEGTSLSKAITVRVGTQQELFNRLLHQVGWMASRSGDPMNPDPGTLGPKYRLTVYTNDKAAQKYDLYPQAGGGPKAFRPADQPSGRVGEAWFYVSISVPELLHAAGIPLADSSGATDASALVYRDPAGYIPAAADVDAQPLFSLGDLLHTQRRTLALWAGTALMVLLLVVCAARFSRRYTHDRR